MLQNNIELDLKTKLIESGTTQTGLRRRSEYPLPM